MFHISGLIKCLEIVIELEESNFSLRTNTNLFSGPECVIHQECPSNRACIAQQCQDPCIGACGFNAKCITQNHQPMCSCMEGFEGDPYASCTPRQSEYLLSILRTIITQISFSNRNIPNEREYKNEFNHHSYLKLSSLSALFSIPLGLNYILYILFVEV